MSARPVDLPRRLALFGGALIVLVVVLEVVSIATARRQALAAGEKTLAILARTSADQVGHTLRELDFGLARVAKGGGSEASGALRDLAAVPAVESAAVYGVDGAVRASTDPSGVASAPIDGERLFTAALQSRRDALRIGTLGARPPHGTRSFAVARAIRDPDGRAAGVVLVRVSPAYLARIHEELSVARGAAARLASDDGVVLFAIPDAADLDGAHAPDLLRAEQAVAGYPVRVTVLQPVDAALAEWRADTRPTALATLALAGLAAALLAIGVIALRRHEAAAARLEEARRAESLSLLAASVAHDFNNVLNAIVGHAELAQSGLTEGSSSDAHLRQVLRAGDRARSLVRRVLTFDPARAVERVPIDLRGAIADTVGELSGAWPPTIGVEIGAVARPFTVLGDPVELSQLIANLVTNAVHAMPNGGCVRIDLEEVGIDAPRQAAVGSLAPGAWLRVAVRDQGVGIAADALPLVFDALYTTRAQVGGTGLGLATVRNVVSSMGGAIEIESAVGVGTCVRVYLRPCAPVAASGAGERVATAGTPGRGEVVLVVDDEAAVLEVVEEAIAAAGFEPVGFTDPVVALASVRADPRRFDAAVLDERMPGLRGIDVARELRALRPDVPVIVVTGYHTAELHAEASALGVVAVLDKPLRPSALTEALAAALRATVPADGSVATGESAAPPR